MENLSNSYVDNVTVNGLEMSRYVGKLAGEVNNSTIEYCYAIGGKVTGLAN